MRTLIVLAAVAALASCSNNGTSCPPPLPGTSAMPLSRPILGFDAPAVLAANQVQLPQGWSGPQRTQCAADPSRAFVAELADSIVDVQVKYHWAPVVSGPTSVVTVQQPEFFAAGQIKRVGRSDIDFPFDHPFGYDLNLHLTPDSGFESLVHTRNGVGVGDIHMEIEMGLYPEADFGYTPAIGDRVLMRGSWIYDCGHPPYDTEMHPPGFLAFAREADASTTVSLAFANPYRVTQTYSHDGSVANDFSKADRYAGTKTFPDHLLDEVLGAAANRFDRIQAHVLVEPTRFETLSWSVCAPSPRPVGAKLGYSYRFTTRTGVTVTATPDEDSGCLKVTAKMDVSYQPAVPTRLDYEYPWDQISRDATAEAGIDLDVRQTIVDALASLGQTGDYPALRADRGPYISTYAPLKARSGAGRDTPTDVTSGANDQPFPFYGRVRAFWCGK